MNERRVRELLRSEPTAAEREAEERAWAVVRTAYAERAASPSRRSRRPLALAVAGGAVLFGLAMSPAGAEVREWIEDVVEPGVENAEPSLTSLPAPGTLVVESAAGTWIVNSDGSKRLLGDFRQATQSPAGAFVAGTRGHELVAVVADADNSLAQGQAAGTVRWTVPGGDPIVGPAWAPSGFRVAYLAGDQLRVVAGDGRPDRLVARGAAAVAPVWRPLNEPVPEGTDGIGTHELAYVDQAGAVRILDTDSGASRGSLAPSGDVVSIGWLPDRNELFVLRRRRLSVDSPAGAGPIDWGFPGRSEAIAAAASSRGEIAVIRQSVSRAEVVLFDPRHPGGGERRVFATDPGRLTGLTWSPDGRWVLLGSPDADQWVFIRPADGKVKAVSNISRQFESGSASSEAFPRPGGWCCP